MPTFRGGLRACPPPRKYTLRDNLVYKALAAFPGPRARVSLQRAVKRAESLGTRLIRLNNYYCLVCICLGRELSGCTCISKP